MKINESMNAWRKKRDAFCWSIAIDIYTILVAYLSAWEAEATACLTVFYGVNLIMMIKLKAAELLTS